MRDTREGDIDYVNKLVKDSYDYLAGKGLI